MILWDFFFEKTLTYSVLDVQNIGSECVDIGLFTISALFRRSQILRRSSHITRHLTGYLFPIYFSIEATEDIIKGATFNQHF